MLNPFTCGLYPHSESADGVVGRRSQGLPKSEKAVGRRSQGLPKSKKAVERRSQGLPKSRKAVGRPFEGLVRRAHLDVATVVAAPFSSPPRA